MVLTGRLSSAAHRVGQRNVTWASNFYKRHVSKPEFSLKSTGFFPQAALNGIFGVGTKGKGQS